jgi:DNA-binding XRE family transcriptional regulator
MVNAADSNGGMSLDDDRIPTARMIRAARGLVELDQSKLGEEVGVDRRTIIRLEADTTVPTNARRIAVLVAIRDLMEKTYNLRFIYADKSTGEGVVMKKGH